MKWLERSWKQFALDGSTRRPVRLRRCRRSRRRRPRRRRRRSTRATTALVQKPALGDDDRRARRAHRVQHRSAVVSARLRGRSQAPREVKGSDTPVKDAWDGEGNLWQGSKKKWQAPARRDRQVRPTGPSWDGARRQRGEQVAVGGREMAVAVAAGSTATPRSRPRASWATWSRSRGSTHWPTSRTARAAVSRSGARAPGGAT